MTLEDLVPEKNDGIQTVYIQGYNAAIDQMTANIAKAQEQGFELRRGLDEENLAKILCPILFGIEWEDTVSSTKSSCIRHANAICAEFGVGKVDKEDLAIILYLQSIYSEMYIWDNLPEGHKKIFLKQSDAIITFLEGKDNAE